MWTADKESLCNMHGSIRYWIMDVRKRLKKAIRENDFEGVKETINTLNEVLEITRKAKKAGQRMEARLVLVRRCTEMMGYIRKGCKKEL